MVGMSEGKVAEEAYNEAISFLQKAKSTEGPSVYEHLTAALGKVKSRRDCHKSFNLSWAGGLRRDSNRPVLPSESGTRNSAVFSCTHIPAAHDIDFSSLTLSSSLQILDERPSNAIDLLETSILTKKTAFEANENTPLVPPKVGWLWAIERLFDNNTWLSPAICSRGDAVSYVHQDPKEAAKTVAATNLFV